MTKPLYFYSVTVFYFSTSPKYYWNFWYGRRTKRYNKVRFVIFRFI